MRAHRRPQTIVLPLLLSGSVAATPAPASPETIPNVVIVGWDGLQRAHLDELLNAGSLPTLELLTAEGSRTDFTINSHFQTATVSGWMSIFTSVWPEDNNNVNIRPHHQTPIPDGWTLFERLRRIEPAATVGWMAQKGFTWVEPDRLMWNLRDDLPDGLVPPYYFKVTSAEDQDDLGRAAVDLILQHDFAAAPLLLFVHFSHPDTAGHNCGENSPAYTDVLIASPDQPALPFGDVCPGWVPPIDNPTYEYGLDHYTGEMMRALQTRGQWESTHFYVTTDHGFVEDGFGHGAQVMGEWADCHDVWLVTNQAGFVLPTAEMVGLSDAILTHLGAPELANLRTRGGAMELGLDLWAPHAAAGGSAALVDDQASSYSWTRAARVESPWAGAEAYLQQGIAPPLAAEEPFQLIGYAMAESFGEAGQSLVVHGRDGRYGDPAVVARLRLAADGLFVSAAGMREDTLLPGPSVPGAWYRLEAQVERRPDGHTLTLSAKGPGMTDPASLSVERNFPVDVDGVLAGDDDPGGATSGVFHWDDLRGYALLTENDFWELEWDHTE